MAVISLVSQKGGVGKSSLARSLAREAAAAGLETKLVDLDTQQGKCLDWARDRNAAGVDPSVSVESYRSVAVALAVADAFDLLVVDGPARASSGTLELARAPMEQQAVSAEPPRCHFRRAHDRLGECRPQQECAGRGERVKPREALPDDEPDIRAVNPVEDGW